MAAGVQQHDRTRSHLVQVGLHAGEVHAAGGSIVVGVVFDDEAGGLEQGAVVFPGGIADVDLGIRVQAFQVVSADAQRAGAADGLGGDHAARGEQVGILAKEQVLDGGVVGRSTFDWLVTARQGGFDAGIFSGLDGGEQGDFPVVVEVHANTEVHLGVTCIGVEGFVQTQNRVARGEFHRGKDRRGHD